MDAENENISHPIQLHGDLSTSIDKCLITSQLYHSTGEPYSLINECIQVWSSDSWCYLCHLDGRVLSSESVLTCCNICVFNQVQSRVGDESSSEVVTTEVYHDASSFDVWIH